MSPLPFDYGTILYLMRPNLVKDDATKNYCVVLDCGAIKETVLSICSIAVRYQSLSAQYSTNFTLPVNCISPCGLFAEVQRMPSPRLSLSFLPPLLTMAHISTIFWNNSTALDGNCKVVRLVKKALRGYKFGRETLVQFPDRTKVLMPYDGWLSVESGFPYPKLTIAFKVAQTISPKSASWG